ncbi:hypothetical protein [Devosia sp. 1635]|uniref:hypothetical protein n=1 Tax=Devosia sp. 1635 TaxID=2726066 RepID=UPI001567597D|nr:hypothetical protein [Devosia sp. 1635]
MKTAAELARLNPKLLNAILSGHDEISRALSLVSVSRAALMSGEEKGCVVDVLEVAIQKLRTLHAAVDSAVGADYLEHQQERRKVSVAGVPCDAS